DPAVSGLSYDNPVLIDRTGSVTIRIAVISRDGKRKDREISYRVETSPVSVSRDASLFLSGLSTAPLISYSAGTSFPLPEVFSCALSDSGSFFNAPSLELSESNNVERFIPVTLSNDSHQWRFILFVRPPEGSRPFFKRVVPFEIRDWETFTFTGTDLIYQIDKEYWSASTESVVLDRSVPHVIRWQSMAYKKGNPVTEFILPEKPELVLNEHLSGDVCYSLSKPGYELSQSGSFFTENAVLSVFENDEIKKEISFDVYSAGVYQGKLSAFFDKDKLPPAAPVITSSASSEFSRREVQVSVSAEKGAKLFCLVSKPVEIDDPSSVKTLSLSSELEFTEFEPPSIMLSPTGKKAVFYKVVSWTEDSNGNKSSRTEYDVTVDRYNFYLSSIKKSSVEDGTVERPFHTLESAVEAASFSPEACIRIEGDITVTSPCVIKNRLLLISSNSVITFLNDSYLKVEDGGLFAKNIFFTKDSSSLENAAPMITAKNSSGGFNNCEFSAVYKNGGIMCSFENSTLSFVDSGFTSRGDSYSLCVSSSDCASVISSCRFTSVSPAAVDLSFSGGNADIRSSSFYIVGSLGRAVEFSSVKVSLVSNEFTLTLDSSVKEAHAVFKDKDTVITENSLNNVTGGLF
ncbi:MAG: hypothetical protein J5780_02250, partial [Treponema sp.]|nr:hypothetical protein [Treponema sp.]